MRYRKAPSQGAYIDRLRTTAPFRICRESEPQYEGRVVWGATAIRGAVNPPLPFPQWGMLSRSF